MSKRWMGIALVAAAVGCGGGQERADAPTGAQAGPGVVADCEAAAVAARAEMMEFKQAYPATAEEFAAIYPDWRATVADWNSEDHVCLSEGPAVMDRLAIHKEVSAELSSTDNMMMTRLAKSFESKPDVEAFLDVLFAGGVKPPDEARRTAFNVAQRSQDADYEAFSEHGWGVLDAEGATTCVTSADPFDPTGEVENQMVEVFEGEIDVHVLCRLPVDASTFAGDEAGKLQIELTRDDWKSEPVTAVDLGAPDKWGKTRFFTARFRVPLKSTRDAETYDVNLVARRPTMGDERIVGTTFWWFR